MEELLTLGIVLLVAKVAEGLSKFLSFPGLLGPLIAGLAIGRFVNVHHLLPLASLGGLMLVFLAGAEEIGKIELSPSALKVGLAAYLVPLLFTYLLFPSYYGAKAAAIAALPGVGVLAKLIKERPYFEVTDLLLTLGLVEGIGIIVYSGFEGGPLEVLLGFVVAALSLKLG